MQTTFNGSQETTYVEVHDADGNVLVAVPGETYELDAAPDALWTDWVAPQEATSQPEPAQIATQADSSTAGTPEGETETTASDPSTTKPPE